MAKLGKLVFVSLSRGPMNLLLLLVTLLSVSLAAQVSPTKIDYNDPASVLEYMEWIKTPKHHKPFLSRVLVLAGEQNYPEYIERFFDLVKGHQAFGFQTSLLKAFKASVKNGSVEVCRLILEVDRDQFSGQLLLPSDIQEGALIAATNEKHEVVEVIVQILGDRGKQLLEWISGRPECQALPMVSLIIENKILMMEIAEQGIQVLNL